MPDNLPNELQTSKLICSAGEIPQTPHTRVLGNWFNSLSARNETPPWSRGPRSHLHVRLRVTETNFPLLPPKGLEEFFRVTIKIFNGRVNDGFRRSSVQPSSHDYVQNLPAVPCVLTPCCSHLSFYVCYFIFKQPFSSIWRAFATLILSLDARERKGFSR